MLEFLSNLLYLASFLKAVLGQPRAAVCVSPVSVSDAEWGNHIIEAASREDENSPPPELVIARPSTRLPSSPISIF